MGTDAIDGGRQHGGIGVSAIRASRPEVAMSTPPGCSARWHAAYSAVWADERVAALLPGVAHANLRRGGGVAVISECSALPS